MDIQSELNAVTRHYPYHFARLDNFLQRIVFDFLSVLDASNLACSSKALNDLFQKYIALALFQEKLCHYFAFGQRTIWKSLLDDYHNQDLLKQFVSVKTSFMDCGGRYCIKTTPFIYALWAKDRFSWEALLPYLMEVDPTGEMVREQMRDHLKNGMTYRIRMMDDESKKEREYEITEHHYDFDDLILPLGIGFAEGRTPAHVRQEYCRPERSFNPLPAFDEKNIQDEAYVAFRKDSGWLSFDWLEDMGISGLGSLFIIINGWGGDCPAIGYEISWVNRINTVRDLAAIRALDAARASDYNTLKDTLLPEDQPVPFCRKIENVTDIFRMQKMNSYITFRPTGTEKKRYVRTGSVWVKYNENSYNSICKRIHRENGSMWLEMYDFDFKEILLTRSQRNSLMDKILEGKFTRLKFNFFSKEKNKILFKYILQRLSQHYCKTLSTSFPLIELDLSYCHFDDEAAKYLSDILIHQNCTLEVLNLKYSKFSDSAGSSLMQALQKNTTLRKLCLFDYDTEDGSFLMHLRLSNLHALSLASYNERYPVNFGSGLKNLLEENPSIKSLKLDYYSDDASINEAVNESVWYSNSLEELSLSSVSLVHLNQFFDGHVKAEKFGQKLQTICLSGQYHQEIREIVFENLKYLPLKKIFIQYAKINSNTLENFILKMSETLEEIEFASVEIIYKPIVSQDIFMNIFYNLPRLVSLKIRGMIYHDYLDEFVLHAHINNYILQYVKLDIRSSRIMFLLEDMVLRNRIISANRIQSEYYMKHRQCFFGGSMSYHKLFPMMLSGMVGDWDHIRKPYIRRIRSIISDIRYKDYVCILLVSVNNDGYLKFQAEWKEGQYRQTGKRMEEGARHLCCLLDETLLRYAQLIQMMKITEEDLGWAKEFIANEIVPVEAPRKKSPKCCIFL